MSTLPTSQRASVGVKPCISTTIRERPEPPAMRCVGNPASSTGPASSSTSTSSRASSPAIVSSAAATNSTRSTTATRSLPTTSTRSGAAIAGSSAGMCSTPKVISRAAAATCFTTSARSYRLPAHPHSAENHTCCSADSITASPAVGGRYAPPCSAAKLSSNSLAWKLASRSLSACSPDAAERTTARARFGRRHRNSVRNPKNPITRVSGVGPSTGESPICARSSCSSCVSTPSSRSSLLRNRLYTVPSATPDVCATSRSRTAAKPPASASCTAASRIRRVRSSARRSSLAAAASRVTSTVYRPRAAAVNVAACRPPRELNVARRRAAERRTSVAS